ncbi:hypothetical protein [Rhizobium oryzicola]|uniref:Uncharacterized protein n=1 Tax=Rhizobium oryzicola TaxID=1232668 RepID=A0ABT8SYT0_9HYPH|nr:hypothetical protein [Rhizobium oryzicola]MDO1583203.1 hypothetical protein [Rhizobium oryzicola]
MADMISSASRPVGSNGLERRLLDPLRLDPSERSDLTANAKSDQDAFEDYLNGNAGISTLPQSRRHTSFDTVDAIQQGSVYGVPVDQVKI